MIKILSTLLLFNGITPDYSGVPSYALPALQQAFADGNYEIIPDPDPVAEPPVPDWDLFNAYMLSDSMFKGYRDTVRTADGDLTGALFDAYEMVDTNGVSAFSLVWGLWVSVSGITVADRETIVGVAEGFNLPADFVSIIRG